MFSGIAKDELDALWNVPFLAYFVKPLKFSVFPLFVERPEYKPGVGEFKEPR
jgi:hypothetical protein